jgi:multiple sugar transport system permease protein
MSAADLAAVALGVFDMDSVAWLSTLDPPLYWIPLVTVRLWLQ